MVAIGCFEAPFGAAVNWALRARSDRNCIRPQHAVGARRLRALIHTNINTTIHNKQASGSSSSSKAALKKSKMKAPPATAQRASFGPGAPSSELVGGGREREAAVAEEESLFQLVRNKLRKQAL